MFQNRYRVVCPTCRSVVAGLDKMPGRIIDLNPEDINDGKKRRVEALLDDRGKAFAAVRKVLRDRNGRASHFVGCPFCNTDPNAIWQKENIFDAKPNRNGGE